MAKVWASFSKQIGENLIIYSHLPIYYYKVNNFIEKPRGLVNLFDRPHPNGSLLEFHPQTLVHDVGHITWASEQCKTKFDTFSQSPFGHSKYNHGSLNFILSHVKLSKYCFVGPLGYNFGPNKQVFSEICGRLDSWVVYTLNSWTSVRYALGHEFEPRCQ